MKKAIKHASQLKNDTFCIAWRLHDVHLQLDTFHVMYIYRYLIDKSLSPGDAII